MDDFIQEIKEDVRKEQLLQLWNRYGNYIIGALLLLIASVAGYEFWKSWSEKQKLSYATQYEKALDLIQQNDFAAAEKQLADLKQHGSKGYQVMAAFELLKLKQKKGQSILEDLTQLSKDKSLPPLYREMAEFYMMHEKVHTGDPKAALDELTTLMTPKHAFYANLLELKGLLYMRLNNVQSAETTFQELIQTEGAPQQLKVRALALLEELGQ